MTFACPSPIAISLDKFNPQIPFFNYRSVGKYIFQPDLMKVRRTFIDKNCLSSGVVSITFIYFLNPPYPSLKYPIQFFLIDIPENRLQGFKRTGLHQPPESVRVFVHCKKQVEVTGG
jgi:hypothetical protein